MCNGWAESAWVRWCRAVGGCGGRLQVCWQLVDICYTIILSSDNWPDLSWTLINSWAVSGHGPSRDDTCSHHGSHLSHQWNSNMEQTYTTYTEVGLYVNNTRISFRLPKLRKPRFFRKKSFNLSNSISSSSQSSSTAASDSSSDWIKDFHARYNPLNTSTPVRNVSYNTNPLDCSGIKIYEDYEDLLQPREELYNIVTIDNRVIARLMFEDNRRQTMYL